MSIAVVVVQLLSMAAGAVLNGIFFGAGFALGAMVIEKRFSK
jgi:hypothetical protein